MKPSLARSAEIQTLVRADANGHLDLGDDAAVTASDPTRPGGLLG
jgi:hypothetical protein